MDAEQVARSLEHARVGAPQPFEVTGSDPVFPARFYIGECAAIAHGLAGSAAARLHSQRTGEEQTVRIDVGHGAATLLSYDYERVDGEPLPPWNVPVTNAMYQCRDSKWIYLQGQLPHLHRGILDLLQCENSAESVAQAVAGWDGQDLEDALADRVLCGAVARTPQEWRDHEHGKVLESLPVVEITKIADGPPVPLSPGTRPLAGVRVLELARILAGPMTGRTLAEHGADVLNVSSPDLIDLFATTTITGHGKRSAYLDFDDPAQLDVMHGLLADCDVFVNGNRAGSLDRHGLGPDELAARYPGLILVSVNCYGSAGPWKQRRGWEQLAQMVSGITIGQGAGGRPQIAPPGAPNDFITGILAAYGAMVALERRSVEGGSWHVAASLTQTAMWIVRHGEINPVTPHGVGDVASLITTDRGPLGEVTHLGPSVQLSRTPARWALPSPRRGADEPAWLTV